MAEDKGSAPLYSPLSSTSPFAVNKSTGTSIFFSLKLSRIVRPSTFHYIQRHRTAGICLCHVQAFFSIKGHIHSEAIFLKALFEYLCKMFFVLNYQDAKIKQYRVFILLFRNEELRNLLRSEVLLFLQCPVSYPSLKIG